MRPQESGEDYLETILTLQKRQGYVRSIDIANELEYTKPSISRAMKILRENDLQKTSFSKYGTEYKKYIAENEAENYVEVRKYA